MNLITKFLGIMVLFCLILLQNVSAQGAGNALSMDGDDYIEISSTAGDELDPADAITLECWVYLNTPPSGTHRPHLIAKNFAYALIVETDASVRMVVYDGSFKGVATATSLIAANQWYHLCGTFNTVDDSFKVYINGQLQAAGVTTTGSINQQDSLVRIGTRLVTVASQFLNGIIDEVRIWNVERTQTQIRDAMTTRLTGNEPGLVGYWRLNEASGTTASDLTAFSNTGTVKTLGTLPSWVTSGASVGDASSYLFTTSWAGQQVSISHPDGDQFSISNVTGNPDGVFVYRVDQAPNVTTVPIGSGWNKLDPLRYWGIFISGGTSPTVDVVYNYQGHPGITNEGQLVMAVRDNNADNTWADAAATLNITANTLSIASSSGGEFILGTQTADNSLPVNMEYFEIISENNYPKLIWKTAAETQNLGFEVFRKRNEADAYSLVSSYKINPDLKGKGNSTVGKKYTFVDKSIPVEDVYYYKIESISFSGKREAFGPVKYSPGTQENINTEFLISDNYPNPFNPLTKIDIFTKKTFSVNFIVSNIMGQVVYRQQNLHLSPGRTTLIWDAENEPSGIYFYTIEGTSSSGEHILKIGKMLYIE